VDETGLFVWNWGPSLDFIEIGFKSSLISYILEINSLITTELIDKCLVYHFKEDISHVSIISQHTD
jgi:hypothetical protein